MLATILNLSPAAAIDYASFNKMGDRTAMTGEWLSHCAARSSLILLAVLGTLFFSTGIGCCEDSSQLDEKAFASPPPEYDAGAYWFWMNGSISKEGITKDLEAQSEKGIRFPILFDINFGVPSMGRVAMMNEEWLGMVKYAAAEAKRLNTHLGLGISPGWTQGGGPWITPELSMKRVVWSVQRVEGGTNVSLSLSPLPAQDGWSKDTYVLACPAEGHAPRLDSAKEVIFQGKPIDKHMLCDGNPHTFVRSEDPKERVARFNLVFDSPCEADQVYFLATHQIWWKGTKIGVRVSGDGTVLSKREVPIAEFNRPLSLSIDRASATNYLIELTVINDPLCPTKFLAKDLSIRELEVLEATEQPQWHCELLDWAQQIEDADGAVKTEGAFTSGIPPAKPVAQNQVIDITGQVTNGVLTWSAPPGQWRIFRFGYTTTGVSNHPARAGGVGLEADKLNASATELQFNSYIKRILDAVGPENRSGITWVESDSWECGKQNWTDDFANEFLKRRGYSLVGWMPVLAGKTVNSRAETLRFLNDFRQTIVDLMTERYFAKSRELANNEGLSFYEETPVPDMFTWARSVDGPMREFWSDQMNGSLISSPRGDIHPDELGQAAYLAGKRVIPAEAFTSWKGDWRWTPGTFGFLGDVAFCQGVTRLILHCSMHQPDERSPGFTMGPIGQHFNRHNTWWPMIDGWLDTVRRKQYVIQNSKFVFDVLVYKGDSMPRQNSLEGYQLPAHAQPLTIDQTVLLNQVSVKDGNLRISGRGEFWALILPAAPLLKPETLEKIAELVNEGATIIGDPPDHAPGLTDYPACDERLREVSLKLWAGLDGKSVASNKVGQGQVFWTKRVNEVLKRMGYGSDLLSTPWQKNDPNLQYAHRSSGDGEIYFFVNQGDHAVGETCRVLDAKNRQPELWDPVSGEVQALETYYHDNGRAVFPISVEGKQSVFVVLRKPAREEVFTRVQSKQDDADPFSGTGGLFFIPGEKNETRVMAAEPKKVFLTSADGYTNIVSVPGVKTMALDTPWRISFDGLSGNPSLTTTQLVSWTEMADEQRQDYSGIATYETEFDISKEFLESAGRVELDLGTVKDVARIWINDELAGTLWQDPRHLSVKNLLHPGNNQLRIQVANTWLNRLLADQRLPENQRSTWTTWPVEYWTNLGVKPEKSGLLGPVSLVGFLQVSTVPRAAKQ